MLAAYLKNLSELELKEVPRPKCGDDEILLKVMACAICGTDVRIFLHGHRKVKFPWIIGHEVSGTIAEIGKNVQKRFPEIKVGDRVQVAPGIACGKCDYCLQGLVCPHMKAIGYDYPGCFAQYLLIPWDAITGNNLIPIPEDVSFAEASLAEPISCAINGLKMLGGISLGETVVIIGSGSLGVVHGKLAKMQGASRIIMVDIKDEKLDLARKVLGDDNVLYIDSTKEDEVKRVLDVTNGEGADKVIIACSSKKAQERSLQMVKMYGKILYFGGLPSQDSIINFNSNALHYKAASVVGTFGSTVYQQKQAIKLISTGFAKDLITHTFPLSKIQEAFKLAISGRALKIIIEPWGKA